MAELKPCPFCGGEAESVSFVNYNPAAMHGKPACRIRCKECGSSTPPVVAQDNTFIYKDLAAERWNRRAEDGNGYSTRKNEELWDMPPIGGFHDY